MNWLQKNLQKIVYIAFIVPIITVAVVSISHVTTWYSLTNTSKWSLYLSFGVEIAALAALAAISVSMGRKVYLPFGIVTLIQLVGNVFYSYTYIDENSKMFKDWVELSNVFFQYIIEDGDVVGHKRILALFSGGLLPIISLSFLHLLVKLQENDKAESETNEPSEIDNSKQLNNVQIFNEGEKINPTEDELKKLEAYLDNLNKVKFGENTDFAPVRPKKGRKLRTDGGVVPRAPRKPRVKKISMDIDDDIETGIKKMVYRKRDGGNN